LVEITSPSTEVTIIDSRNGLVLKGSNLDAGVTFLWSATGTPDGATVSFGSPDEPTTTARFSTPGVYTVRLDGTRDTFTTGEEITVVVEDSSLTVSPVGLVANWTFDEGDGIFAGDTSGNGYFGTLIDGVPWTPGITGDAVNFSASSAYIDITEHLDHFRDLDRGTIACWFRTNTGSERTIFSASDSGDSRKDLRLYIDDTFLKFKVRGDVGTSGSSINSGRAVNDNRWHHAAVTVDAARNATLYLDGTPIATGVRPFFSGVFDLDSLRIGNVVHSNSAAFRYRGDVDDLRVYSRPLSPDEIALLAGAAAERAPRVDLPDTVAVSPTPTFPLGTLSPAVSSNTGPATTLWIDPGNNPTTPTFSSPATPGTDVILPTPGNYTLRLTATGATATTFDDTTVTRTSSPDGTPATLGIPDIVTHQNAADTTIGLWPVFFDPATRRSDTLTFTLQSVSDPALFAATTITGTPDTLTLAYAPSVSGTSDITIRATATGGSSADTTFRVTVENAAPTVARQSFSVAEGAPNGTRVGLVAATDIDRDPLGFRLIADPSNGAFHLDPNTGAISVVDTAKLDFETGATLPLTVLVTDPQHTNPGTLATISLNLTDSNEPPAFADLNVDLPEASPAGTTVATLSASDPDGGSLGYAIVGGNTGNAFEIDADNGFLSVRSSAPLNTTSNPRFNLSVQVTDDGDPALSAIATVRVTLQKNLLAENATARYRVPTSSAEGTTWRARSFDDTAWSRGRYGFGYDTAGDYDDLIDTDLENSMFESAASLYLRSSFTLDDPGSLTKLLLRVKYDDGFVAYLNGVEIAAANEPGNTAWDSTATGSHADGEAVEFEDFDVSNYLNRLATGNNVIAFHAMNRATDNSDFLFVPQLVASATGTAQLPDPPSLSLSSAIGVTTSGARLRGTLDTNGGENPELFFVWGTSDGGDSINTWQNTTSVGTGTVGNGYSLNLTGLNPGTTYFFNFLGTNGGGTTASATRSFTTTAVPADTLVAASAPATALVPTDASLGTSWLSASFDDSSWNTGRTGAGYETGNGYQNLIDLDLESTMFEKNPSAYIRIPFAAPRALDYDTLTLRMQYDDGFVAYLNGIEIARRNAPPGQPLHNSAATANHDDSDATVFEDIDASQFRGALRTSTNLLAIHGLNAGTGSSDFLILPVLEAADTDGTTNPARPALGLSPAVDIAGRSASIGGTLSSTGGQRPAVTVYWGTTNAGTDAGSWQNASPLGSLAAGQFAAHPSHLLPETTYFFTARATNTAGSTWATTPGTFTTSTAAPVTTTLVGSGYPATYLTPTDGLLGNAWTNAAFDDSTWSGGNAGFGFHTAGTYAFLLGTNLIAARSITPSAYVRTRFTVADPSVLLTLTLRLKYDDAFVAYLNGVEVARSSNAPANPGWDSVASATRPVDTAVLFEPFEIPPGAVVAGENVLAIHALNRSSADPEFLLVPQLLATSLAPLTTTPNGYLNWSTTFDLTGPAADPAADPDSDGLANLLEFALASSPVVSSPSPLLVTPSADGGSTILTFTRRTGIPTTVESSPDATTWQPAQNITTISVTPLPGSSSERVTLSVPNTSTTTLLRLDVTLDP
ncbi:MAG: cadherin domain-containing protein, partial [Verrucomicrobiales bacterium]|nr:cadherin domain-containing protein [Verrucomicrobiales bacterium]